MIIHTVQKQNMIHQKYKDGEIDEIDRKIFIGEKKVTAFKIL